ncbi:MAG: hypothetical protein LQ340_008123, partial [Diploschistes diacapsis]
ASTTSSSSVCSTSALSALCFFCRTVFDAGLFTGDEGMGRQARRKWEVEEKKKKKKKEEEEVKTYVPLQRGAFSDVLEFLGGELLALAHKPGQYNDLLIASKWKGKKGKEKGKERGGSEDVKVREGEGRKEEDVCQRTHSVNSNPGKTAFTRILGPWVWARHCIRCRPREGKRKMLAHQFSRYAPLAEGSLAIGEWGLPAALETEYAILLPPACVP